MTTHSAANPSPGARGQIVARPRTQSPVEAPASHRATNEPTPLTMITIETAVYALLMLIAAATRLWDLGSQPLSPREAGLALAGIRFDGSAPPADVGAFLRYGSAVTMGLFGATDFSARLVPALVGASLPLAAYLLRPLLGHTVTIFGAALLTISPLMVDQSRLVGNGSIVGVLALVAFALGARFILLAKTDDLWPLAVALGFLVVSGPTGFSALTVLILLIVGIVMSDRRVRRPRSNANEPTVESRAPRVSREDRDGHTSSLTWPDASNLRTALIVFGLSTAIVASGALINIAGIGETIASAVGVWLAGFTRPTAEIAPANFWILPVYEPAVLAAGILGGVMVWRSRDLVGRAIVAWAVLAFLLAAIRPGRLSEEVALVVVPLALLTAIAITHLFVEVVRHGSSRSVGAVILALSILAGLQVYVTSHLTDPRPFVGDAVIVMPLLTAAVALYAFYTWLGRRSTELGIASFAVLAMLAFTVHSTWQVAYFSTGNVSELTRQRQTTPDARTLVRDVDEILSVLSMNQKE
ncbi:MAG TPA: glycosyltransferase family 39 protein, partial [Chloroflexota bacterium]|nr:glycosyltransferase family 39 protein [Chloroflexota bacterium]